MTTHGILETLPNMTKVELKDFEIRAIRNSLVLLCPAPAGLYGKQSHTGMREQVHKLAENWPTRQILCPKVLDGMINAQCPFVEMPLYTMDAPSSRPTLTG